MCSCVEAIFSLSLSLCVSSASFSQTHIHRWWHSVRINKSSSLGCFHSFSRPSHALYTHNPPSSTYTHLVGHVALSSIDHEERPFFFLMNTVNTNGMTICLFWGTFSFLRQAVRPLAVSHLNNLRSIALTTAPGGCKIACYHFNGSTL